ncbi:MAG: DUF3343 domain-containing protein [Clostridia bacterium]|nr:DUF3343 domain-containing protein [Clostridia bacterium]
MYVATFFSHFGAVKFSRRLKSLNIAHMLKPVPRKVSSSCGTCVEFECDSPLSLLGDELDAIYANQGEDVYAEIWSASKDA